eukprot:SAG31_NODE_27624_length_423_cov_0.614198_1_plen_103_part_10
MGDNDKVACHGIRALGYLAAYWPASVDPHPGSINGFTIDTDDGKSGQLLDALLSAVSSGAAKVSWNACYALAKCIDAPGFMVSMLYLRVPHKTFRVKYCNDLC